MSHVKNVLMVFKVTNVYKEVNALGCINLKVEVTVVWKNVRGVSIFVNNAYQFLAKSNETFMSIETNLNELCELLIRKGLLLSCFKKYKNNFFAQ
jgi:hypothetical protein